MFDDTTVDIEPRRDYLFRATGSVLKFAGCLAVYARSSAEAAADGPGPDAVTAEDEEASSLLPPLARRRGARAAGAEAGAALHPAAAALQRGDAGQGARRERHRPPVHLRHDPRVIQARDYVEKIEGRFCRRRSACSSTKLLSTAFDDILDVELHARAGRGARRDRGGRPRTTGRRSPSSTRSSRRTWSAPRSEMRNVKEGVERIRRSCDKCGKPMVIKAGSSASSSPAAAIPECKNTRELETPDGRGRRRGGHRGGVREVRQADGAQARPLRPVPRLHRLSRVQDDAQDHRDQAGDDRRQAGQILDEKCPKCESNLVHQARPLRRVHGLHATIRPASTSSRRRPACCARRTAATSSRRSRGAARCSTAAPTTRTATSRCGTSRSPRSARLRRAVPGREDHEAARPSAVCNNEECSLRPVRGAGAA